MQFMYCINIFLFYNMSRDTYIYAITKRKMPVNESAKAFFVSLNVEDENGEV